MTKFPTPSIDWAALSPELVLLGGAAVCLVVPLFLPHAWRRHFCAFVSVACFIGAGAAAIALFQMDETGTGIVANALRRDRLAELGQVLVIGSGLLTVGVSYTYVLRERMGEYYALLLTAAAGMCFFVSADDLMTMFLGLEWFSISLYILCAIAIEELASLEAGLKYLIVGSFGSAILLFGSAFVYGATGVIGFEDIAAASSGADSLFLVTGLAMIIVGLAFKASAAPFHMLVAVGVVALAARREWRLEGSSAEIFSDIYEEQTRGHLEEVSVLFADLQGYTAFSERTPEPEIKAMLDTYFPAAAPVLQAHGGELYNTIGDAIMPP